MGKRTRYIYSGRTPQEAEEKFIRHEQAMARDGWTAGPREHRAEWGPTSFAVEYEFGQPGLAPVRVSTYTGATPDEAARAFEADAREAVAAGYRPTSQAWSGSSLTVTYQLEQAPAGGGAGGGTGRIAAYAWIVAAITAGLLALLQVAAASSFGSLDSSNELVKLATLNGIGAVVTLYFAARLLRDTDSGTLTQSFLWGGLSTAWGVVQVANGATSIVYLILVVMYAAASVLSFLAVRELNAQGG